ncbi:MAG: hypothetical protein M3R48_05090 [Candidatus Dormibacteraeota bacterium]|nr:hypothetical protein [Candidatus Dormibacteraeota bacterium]
MTDEIDEVTDRSGKPHVWIEVEGQQEPYAGVVLIFRVLVQGELNTVRMPFDILEAKNLADTIMGTADGVAYAARNG